MGKYNSIVQNIGYFSGLTKSDVIPAIEYITLGDPEQLDRFRARAAQDLEWWFIIGSICRLLRDGLPGLTDEDLRAVEVLRALMYSDKRRYTPTISAVLLEVDGPHFSPDVLEALRTSSDPQERYEISAALAAYDFAKYGRQTYDLACDCLANGTGNSLQCARWMLMRFPDECISKIAQYVRKATDRYGTAAAVITESVKALGHKATAILQAGLDAQGGDARYESLQHLVGMDADGAHREMILAALERGLREEPKDSDGKLNTALMIRYITLAAKWDASAVVDDLGRLLEHKSKPVREAAARAVGQMGDDALPIARGMLGAKKADARMQGVIILRTAASPGAVELLEAQLDREENDDVRESILLGIQDAWRAAGKKLSREDVEFRIAATAKRIYWPPSAWAKDLRLDAVHYSDGGLVPEEIVRYLIARQAKCAEVKPTLEIVPLCEVIDRESSADLALSVLSGFVNAGADAKDKWALTIAGMLGDDRVVPVMNAEIKRWADANRGKLAEYAVQALALLGSDRALLIVDSLATRYRSKMKNIGAAAVEAFNAAAEAKGVTPEELGDRVVPWLGFEPGRPRVIDCGGRRIEARIGPDFKLLLTDLEKRKRIGSLPSSAPDEVRAEFKELSGIIREAAKSQLLRMENLMVRQHRWPVERWQELFLAHPLLMPFGMRLVWGAYDDSGALASTFRSLDDQTLTDRADEPVDLPQTGRIGIVHPLELDDDARQQWLSHLADYEIQPPFPQLERPVIRPTEEQSGLKFYKDIAGTEINGMTFKGRAERLGWRRGSVCDAGSVSSYVKSFPSAGADAFLLTEDMFVGMDMYSEVTLQDVFFVQSGSVKTGSYVYDEPANDSDPRLIPLSQVPPIVFSEVMGDLARIAKSSDQGGEVTSNQ